MSSRVMNMTLSFDSAKALRQTHAQVRRVRSRGFTLPTKTGKSSAIKKTYERRGEFSAEQLGQNTGRTPEGINNSGKVLNVVDLMVAKSWSTTFNLRSRLNKFREELKRERYDEIPDITIIQCLSVIVNGGACRKDILDIDRSLVELNWERALECIRLAIDFLKNGLKVTHAKILPYNACLVPIAFYFNEVESKAQNDKKRRELERWFWQVSLSNRYDRAADTKIGEDVAEMAKLARGEEPIFEHDPLHLSVERLIAQKLNLGSAFCKTILCALNQRGPKDFKDCAPVSLTSFSKFNSAELHHVFPVAYLRDKDREQYSIRDSIVNVALARSAANKQYSSRPPSDYLNDCGNPKLDEALSSHLIPDLSKSGLLQDDFQAFLDYRGRAILRELRKLSGTMSQVESEMDDDKFGVLSKFEHRMRALLNKVLGDDFQNALTPNLREKLELRIKCWEKDVPGRKREDAEELDLLLILDYLNIIKNKSNWENFEPFFKSRSKLEHYIKIINSYRNPATHFRELDELQSKEAETALLWFERVFDAAGIA